MFSFYLSEFPSTFPVPFPLFKEQKHSGTLTINIERVALDDVVAAGFGRVCGVDVKHDKSIVDATIQQRMKAEKAAKDMQTCI